MPRTAVQHFRYPQKGYRRSNPLCGVVERPDHHCGDDLVESWKATEDDTNPQICTSVAPEGVYILA